MERANIKVPRELFEELRDDKESETWSAYLRENCLESKTGEFEELHRRLDSLPQETAEEIEQRLR
ncbi:hypothetical protein [Halorussus salinisoli]|uniref:hypothetical protein n=1 Tax=Halorussus salinisoli TaxID=2558242 RepID=UPI0010C21BC2|nr:hypothetical protein [Halorussus salinisoli]